MGWGEVTGACVVSGAGEGKRALVRPFAGEAPRRSIGDEAFQSFRRLFLQLSGGYLTDFI